VVGSANSASKLLKSDFFQTPSTRPAPIPTPRQPPQNYLPRIQRISTGRQSV
jgi:hypothetical protein